MWIFTFSGNNAYGSLPRSICNSKGRPNSALDKSNNEAMSENGSICNLISTNLHYCDYGFCFFIGSNQGSDLYMRFADEPLYQFYAALISEVCYNSKQWWI